MVKKLIASIIIVTYIIQNEGLSCILANPAENHLRPPAAALNPDKISQVQIKSKLRMIRKVNAIMGIGTVNSKPGDIELGIESPILEHSIPDEVADTFCAYFSMLSHIAGNYSIEDDKKFRESQIWKRINTEIVDTDKPLPLKYFKLLWKEALRQVKKAEINRLKEKIPKEFLPGEGSSDMQKLERWLRYMLANFRMITFRRDAKRGNVFLTLKRYLPAEIRMALIRTPAEDPKAVAKMVADKQAVDHLIRLGELIELCEALRAGGYYEDADTLPAYFEHALSVTHDNDNPEVYKKDSDLAITKLLELGRKTTGNQYLSVTDLIKMAFVKRCTRNFLGFVHPELPWKDKFLEKIWSAELFVLAPQLKSCSAGSAEYQENMKLRYLYSKRFYLHSKIAQIISVFQNAGIDKQASGIFVTFYIVYYLKTELNYRYHEEFFEKFLLHGLDTEFVLGLLKLDDYKNILDKICTEFKAENRKEEMANLILTKGTGLLDTLYLSKDSIKKKRQGMARIARQEYDLINSEAETRRRYLLYKSLSLEFLQKYDDSKTISIEMYKPEFFTLGLTWFCGMNCRHCQLVYRASRYQAGDSQAQNKRWLRYLEIAKQLGIDMLALTGGEIIKWAKDELLFIIRNSADMEFIQFNTNADFADTVDNAKRVLAEVWQARSERAENAKRLKMQICISLDNFHQEVLSDSDGRLYERIPLKNVANLIQAIIEDYPAIDISIASNLSKNQMDLVSQLREELETEERGYTFKLKAMSYVPTTWQESRLPPEQLIEKGVLQEAAINFYKIKDGGEKRMETLGGIFFDFINTIGWAEILDPSEFHFIEGVTEEYFKGRVKLGIRNLIEAMSIDRDGNINFKNPYLLRAWSFANAEKDDLGTILSLADIDPLLFIEEDYVRKITEIASEVIDEETLKKIKNATHPLMVHYRLIRSPALRLYTTQRLLQEKYRDTTNALSLLELDRDMDSLKAEYRELVKQEPDRAIIYEGLNLLTSTEERLIERVRKAAEDVKKLAQENLKSQRVHPDSVIENRLSLSAIATAA